MDPEKFWEPLWEPKGTEKPTVGNLTDWTLRCARAERELEETRAELKVNAVLLAKQCDMARQAEMELAEARAELAALRSEWKTADRK